MVGLCTNESWLLDINPRDLRDSICLIEAEPGFSLNDSSSSWQPMLCYVPSFHLVCWTLKEQILIFQSYLITSSMNVFQLLLFLYNTQSHLA